MFGMVSPIFSLGQTAYICIPTASTGFSIKNGGSKWETTRFRIDDVKKILKRNNGKWEWSKFGESLGFSDCGGDDFGVGGDFNSAGYIFCNTFGGHVRMNKKTLRYIETYEIGFIDGKDLNTDTPSIDIGTCSPL